VTWWFGPSPREAWIRAARRPGRRAGRNGREGPMHEPSWPMAFAIAAMVAMSVTLWGAYLVFALAG
jgi:hypothetical protein